MWLEKETLERDSIEHHSIQGGRSACWARSGRPSPQQSLPVHGVCGEHERVCVRLRELSDACVVVVDPSVDCFRLATRGLMRALLALRNLGSSNA